MNTVFYLEIYWIANNVVFLITSHQSPVTSLCTVLRVRYFVPYWKRTESTVLYYKCLKRKKTEGDVQHGTGTSTVVQYCTLRSLERMN